MTRAHQGLPRTLDELIARAEDLKAGGHGAMAASLYESWISGDKTPARALAYFNLGVLRSDMGQLDAAHEAYAAALEMNPAFHQARINDGLVAERQGRDADAARAWLGVAGAVASGQRDALPMATMALNHLGRLQEQRRHYAEAESALSHSLQLDPTQADAIQPPTPVPACSACCGPRLRSGSSNLAYDLELVCWCAGAGCRRRGLAVPASDGARSRTWATVRTDRWRHGHCQRTRRTRREVSSGRAQ